MRVTGWRQVVNREKGNERNIRRQQADNNNDTGEKEKKLSERRHRKQDGWMDDVWNYIINKYTACQGDEREG